MQYLNGIIKGCLSLAAGLRVTLKHVFKPSVTQQYPEEKPVLPLRFRGRLALPVDPAKGANRCVACMLCVKACPNHSIDIVKASAEGKPLPKALRYKYNLATCMFCNLCVEACPFAALVMTDEYELASASRADFTLDLVAEKYVLTGKKQAWWLAKFKSEESAVPAAGEAK